MYLLLVEQCGWGGGWGVEMMLVIIFRLIMSLIYYIRSTDYVLKCTEALGRVDMCVYIVEEDSLPSECNMLNLL